VLLHCESRNGGGHYWRIRLTSGEWVWPDDTLAIDGPGGVLAAEPCQSCELPFITVAGSPELICDRCSAEQFGTAARTDPPPAKRWNARRRWRP
jgi:hypothetical protein